MAKVSFIVDCTMEERWGNDFMSMLKYMESCGNLGHSSIVGFYCRIWDETVKDFVNPEELIYDYGYTDENQIEGWLKYYNVPLEDFLTMKKYIIVVDGDEYGTWKHI